MCCASYTEYVHSGSAESDSTDIIVLLEIEQTLFKSEWVNWITNVRVVWPALKLCPQHLGGIIERGWESACCLPVCVCGSRLMRDHLEEIGFGTTPCRTALCCTRSLRKVKMERRRKADLSYIYLFHFPDVSCSAVVWIKVSNPSFLSQIIEGFFVSFLSPWHSVKEKWQYSQFSLTDEWFVLAAGSIIQKKQKSLMQPLDQDYDVVNITINIL